MTNRTGFARHVFSVCPPAVWLLWGAAFVVALMLVPSPESILSLRPNGIVFSVLTGWLKLPWFRGLLADTAALLATGGAVLFALRGRLSRFADAHLTPVAGGRLPLWFWAAYILAVTLWYDAAMFSHGHWLLDDTHMVYHAMRTAAADLVICMNNDHILPLYYLQLKAVLTLFGLDKWAFNLWHYATYVSMLAAGVWMLRVLSVSSLLCLLFVPAVCGWMGWSAGLYDSYIQMKYLQIAALGFGATGSFVRWADQRDTRNAALCLLCNLVSAHVDVSGVFVPLSTALLAILYWLFFRQDGGGHGKRAAVLTGVCAFSLAWIQWLMALATRKGGAYIHSLRGADLTESGRPVVTAFSVPDAVARWFYYLESGLLQTLVMPNANGVLNMFGIMDLFHHALLVAAAAFFGFAVYAAPVKIRVLLLYCIGLLAGFATIMVLGRWSSPYPFYWYTRYMEITYPWLCVALALAAQGFLRKVPDHRRAGYGLLLVALLILHLTNQRAFDQIALHSTRLIGHSRSTSVRELPAREKRFFERLREFESAP